MNVILRILLNESIENIKTSTICIAHQLNLQYNPTAV